METLTLKKIHLRPVDDTGLFVTELGLGGAAFGNAFFSISDEQVHETIRTAWASGIRYFDSAPLYGFGLSERRMGDALRSYPRSHYAFSTKVGRLLLPDRTPKIDTLFPESLPFHVKFDYSYDGIMRSFEDSLQRIGTDYIDILFIDDINSYVHGGGHDSFFHELTVGGGGRALADLRSQKLVHAVGLGVDDWQTCVRIIPHVDLDCCMIAGLYTLLDQTILTELFPICERGNISIIASGVYNSGILATGARANSYYNYKVADSEILARVRKIETVCEEFDVDLPQAAINFPLLHPQVSAVVVGAHTPEQFLQNNFYFKKTVPRAFWYTLKQQGLLAANAPVAKI
jgi:D-threo-aldose 1-dehydrogenase